MLKHLDFFSGIGGFSLAAKRTGKIETLAFCEIDKYCRRVLSCHWPEIEILEDVRIVNANKLREYGRIDLLTSGFPCQDLSTAGARAGLSGERSGLWFEFARIINEAMPKWVLIENVPGLLTSQQGQDFQVILNQMAEFGYCVAWRILDAQYAGVPQRRRRVFIVCSSGNTSAGEVLFDTESDAGYTKESETEEHQTTGTSGESAYSFDSRNHSVSYSSTQTLQAKPNGGWSLNYMPVVGRYWDGGDLSDTLDTSMLMKGQMMLEKRRFPVVREPQPLYYTHDYNHQRVYSTEGISPALATDKEWKFLVDERLRRLTPKECTKLMGYPADYLEIYEKKNDTREVLRSMWREIGKKDLSGWGFRVIQQFLTPEILLSGVYVGWLSWEMAYERARTSREIQGTNTWTEDLLSGLWENWEARSSSYRRESFEQFFRKSGRSLSELPLEETQIADFVRYTELWEETQKEWSLRYAFSTNEEGENRPISDTQKYKMLGNSVVVPVVKQIMERIAKYDR